MTPLSEDVITGLEFQVDHTMWSLAGQQDEHFLEIPTKSPTSRFVYRLCQSLFKRKVSMTWMTITLAPKSTWIQLSSSLECQYTSPKDRIPSKKNSGSVLPPGGRMHWWSNVIQLQLQCFQALFWFCLYFDMPFLLTFVWSSGNPGTFVRTICWKKIQLQIL